MSAMLLAPPCRSVGHPAAVDHQVHAADVRGIIRGQERHRRGDITRLAQPAERGSAPDVRAGFLPAAEVARRAGHDLARGDRVAHDPVAPVLDRDLAGQLDQPALADGVGGMARRAYHAVLRNDVDDPAADVAAERLGEHLPYHHAAEQERAFEVHRDDRVEVVVAGLQQRLGVGPGERRVVDHHVEASRALDGQGHQPLAVLAGGDVGPDVLARAAAARDDLVGWRAAGERVPPHVGQQHPEAVGRQPRGDGPADPRRGAGDYHGARHPREYTPGYTASMGVAFVAHCLLNQNSKVGDGAHCAGIYSPVVDVLRDKGWRIEQMPCPELAFTGLNRFWAVREQLDTPEYRRYCRRLASGVADMIAVRAAQGEDIVLIGVEGSPSMGVHITSSDPARGGRPAWPDGSPELTGGEGIFVEELHNELARRGITFRVAGERHAITEFTEADQRARLESVLEADDA